MESIEYSWRLATASQDAAIREHLQHLHTCHSSGANCSGQSMTRNRW